MNIVYIIGNGFDRNLDLKTSYQEFYDYFIKQSSNKTLVADMKDNLDRETWADLEVALGKYTEKFETTAEFTKVYYEISDKLAEYIRLVEEEQLVLSEERKQKLCNDLIFPEQYFRLVYKNFITEYREKWQNQASWNINIINFNYTQTIEKLLDFQIQQNLLLGKNRYGRNVNLSQIVHIHGIAAENKTILLGVNDFSQIANESFRGDNDFLDIMIKPQTNKGSAEGIDANCVHLLRAANLICIFGSSIGETDKIWWELLGKQLERDDCRVIYFVKENEIIPENRQQLWPKKIRECQSHILSKTNLPSQVQEQVRDKIWVGHNTKMFKLENTQKE